MTVSYTNESVVYGQEDIPEDMVIGGTTMAALIGASDWSSPFMAKLSLLGLYKSETNSAMVLGQTMEEDIIHQLEETHGPIQRFPPISEDYQKWDWHLRSGIFGAHLDGLMSDTIVEVKTTSNIGKWVDAEGNPTIPKGYYVQASLYAWLQGASDILFAIGVVNPGAYSDSLKIPDYELVELHVQPMHIAAPNMWKSYLYECESAMAEIESGKLCPDMNDPRDIKLMRELTQTEVDSESMTAKLDRLTCLNNIINKLTVEAESLKESIKTYLSLQIEDGNKATIADSNGKIWTYTKYMQSKTNYKQACADNNIDLTSYTTQEVQERLNSPTEKKEKKTKETKEE